jgi:putative acetyltransferase
LLREKGALALSLVFVRDDAVAGHVAFSPVLIDGQDRGWFGLGPIAVDPPFQRRGIGRAMIQAGLEQLKARGARGCVLTGNPDLYTRVGFTHTRRLTYAGGPPEVCMIHPFGADIPQGKVEFDPAFDIEPE